MLNIAPAQQLDINTASSLEVSTSGTLIERLRTYVVSPPVERWAYAYMELRKLFKRELHKQIDAYYAWKNERYPSSARSDREYLMQLLKATKARSVI